MSTVATDCDWKKKYQTTANWFDAFDTYADRFDGMCKLGAEAPSIVAQSLLLSNKHVPSSMSSFISQVNGARTVISTARLPGTFYKIATGRVLKSETGEWLPLRKMALEIFLVIGRLLSPINWFHKLGAVDLGKHARTVSLSTGVAFAGVQTLSLVGAVESFQNYLHQSSQKLESIDPLAGRSHILNILTNVADTAAIPWDCGFVDMTNGKVALVGAIVCTISASTSLIKEALLCP